MRRNLFILLILLMLAACSPESQSGGINPMQNFNAMWDYQKPDQTEQLFLSVLKTVKNSAETSYDRNYHVELLTQIARAQGMQGKFELAEQTLNSADSLITENTKTGKIRFLLEKGRLLNSSDKREDAGSIFLQAYNYGTAQKLDFYTLDSIHMLAIVESPEKQLAWNLKAINIAANSDDMRCKSSLGTLYSKVGWRYHDLADYAKAMEYFQDGLEYRQNSNDAKATRIAKWTVGRCYRSLKEYAKAKEIMLALEKEIDENELPKDGYVYEELAELYQLEKDSKAKKYFGLAYQIQSQDSWIVKNEAEKLARMKKIAE